MTTLPYSQAYQATTLSDLWEYTLLPPEQRISLRRRTECGRPTCKTKLRPPRDVRVDCPTDTQQQQQEPGERMICPKCRDQLYCSQQCAKRDKYRHGVECAYNKTDILKCTILEDTAGVISFLLQDPKLSTKMFGGHYILEWARRAGYDPVTKAINSVASEALGHAIDDSSERLIAHFIEAGVAITDAHIQQARDKGRAPEIVELLVAAKTKEKPKADEKSVYVERAKKPLPPEEPRQTFQDMFNEQMANLAIGLREEDEKKEKPHHQATEPALYVNRLTQIEQSIERTLVVDQLEEQVLKPARELVLARAGIDELTPEVEKID